MDAKHERKSEQQQDRERLLYEAVAKRDGNDGESNDEERSKCRVSAQRNARLHVVDHIVSLFSSCTIRMGRMTAQSKADGGVRGIVVGNLFRRLVSRTIAPQIAKSVEAATSPFQYALSTKARTECVSHMLQTFTDMDGKFSIFSIDGIGALRPCALEFEMGDTQVIPHGEGGEQGDPFMLLLFCLSLHALVAADARLQEGVSIRIP